jgi:hypothetical protein
MFSQGSDYSEIMESEDTSSAALQTIQQRVRTQEIALADSDICDANTQSTYFSSDPDLHPRFQNQTESVSHATVHAKFMVQADKPENNMLVNINSNDTNHVQSADASNNQSTSDIRQNGKELTVNSKEAKSNSECTASMNGNKNVNVVLQNPNSQSIFNQTKNSDLPHLTGSMCMYTPDKSKEQATNSSKTSGEKLIMNIQSITHPPDNTCFKPLQISNTTDEHNQNRRDRENSTIMKNCNETSTPTINIKKYTEISHSTIKNQTKHKGESRTNLMSNVNSQPMKNATQLSVTSRNERQMENLQQSVSKPQEFTTVSQSSDHSGVRQNVLTQSEQGSFIFGIKRIWSHSASEFVPNNQLPEDFWKNKATPVPKDLLLALESW